MTDNERIDPSPNPKPPIDSIRLEWLKLQKDVLWGEVQDYRQHARHSQTFGATLNTLVIAVSAGLLGVVGDTIQRTDLLPAIFIAVLGVLGAVFSVFQTGRYVSAKTRERAYEMELDNLLFSATHEVLEPDEGEVAMAGKLVAIRKRPYGPKLKGKWRRLKRWLRMAHLNLVWIILPLVVFSVGCYLALLSLDPPAPSPTSTPAYFPSPPQSLLLPVLARRPSS